MCIRDSITTHQLLVGNSSLHYVLKLFIHYMGGSHAYDSNRDQESHIVLKIKHENHLCAYDVHLLTNLIVRCNPLIWFSLLSWRPKEHWPQNHARILIFEADWVWWCPLLSSSYWNLLTFLVWHIYDSYMRKENTDTVASHHLFLFFSCLFYFSFNML